MLGGRGGLCILLVEGNGNYEEVGRRQIASNALNEEYNTRQDNIFTRQVHFIYKMLIFKTNLHKSARLFTSLKKIL